MTSPTNAADHEGAASGREQEARQWTIVEYGDGDSLVIHENDVDRVCFMATHGGSRKQWDKIQANARLIAAAPDMLAALQLARKAFITETVWKNDASDRSLARDAIKCAIRKATGA